MSAPEPSPTASDDTTAPAGRPARRGDALLWGGLVLALAAGLAWGFAQAPPALKRPILTPVACGMLLGWLAARVALVMERRERTAASIVIVALAGIGLVAAAHAQIYQSLVVAAQVRGRERPQDRAGLGLLEAAARNDATLEPELRAERLQWQPTLADYLTQRASPGHGTTPWPWPLVLIVCEALLCSAAAIMIFRRTSDSQSLAPRAARRAGRDDGPSRE